MPRKKNSIINHVKNLVKPAKECCDEEQEKCMDAPKDFTDVNPMDFAYGSVDKGTCEYIPEEKPKKKTRKSRKKKKQEAEKSLADINFDILDKIAADISSSKIIPEEAKETLLNIFGKATSITNVIESEGILVHIDAIIAFFKEMIETYKKDESTKSIDTSIVEKLSTAIDYIKQAIEIDFEDISSKIAAEIEKSILIPANIKATLINLLGQASAFESIVDSKLTESINIMDNIDSIIAMFKNIVEKLQSEKVAEELQKMEQPEAQERSCGPSTCSGGRRRDLPVEEEIKEKSNDDSVTPIEATKSYRICLKWNNITEDNSYIRFTTEEDNDETDIPLQLVFSKTKRECVVSELHKGKVYKMTKVTIRKTADLNIKFINGKNIMYIQGQGLFNRKIVRKRNRNIITNIKHNNILGLTIA